MIISTYKGVAIPVKPSIIGPSHVSICDDLYLDLSSSSGNGGRIWKEVKWVVFNNTHNLNERNKNIEAYMNGLSWTGNSICLKLNNISQSDNFYGCSRHSIPRSVLSVGIYTFVVTMTNYMNISGSGTFSTKFISTQHFPTVIIDGMNQHTISSGQDVILRARFMASDKCLDLGYDKSGIRYLWSVIRDNTTPHGIQPLDSNINYRGSTFVYPSRLLLEGHEYIFRLEISYGSGDRAFAETWVYVMIPSYNWVIDGGNRQTISSSKAFYLTATTVSSVYSNLSLSTRESMFVWRCISLSPFKGTCGNLNNKVYNDISVIGIQDQYFIPGNSLDVNGIYSFSLSVLDRSYSSISSVKPFVYTSIIVIAVVGDIPRVKVPTLVMNIDPNSISTVYSSIYSPTNDVSLLFNMSDIDSSLTDKISYYKGIFSGSRTIPLRLLSPLLSGGGKYTLQLTVTSNCKQGVTGCNALFTTEIFVNEPPGSGNVYLWPTSGTNSIPYTAQALFWTDIDLPLRYSFYRFVNTNKTQQAEAILGQLSYLNSIQTYLAPGVA